MKVKGRLSDIEKLERTHHQQICRRNVKGNNTSSRKKIMPGRNMKLHERMKSTGNGHQGKRDTN